MQTDMTVGKPMKMLLNLLFLYFWEMFFNSCTVWQMQLLLESLLEPRGWQR